MGVSRLRADLQARERKWEVNGEGRRVMRMINSVGKKSGLWTDLPRKGNKEG